MNSAADFPRDARLLNAAEFKQVFNARQRIGGRFFLLQWCPGKASTARLGRAISRKADPRAVGRNRIKRLLRDCFRQQRARLPVCDLVFLAKPEARQASNQQLREEIQWLWRKLCALPGHASQGTMPAAPTAVDDVQVTPSD